jgi:recombination protein RecA
MSDDLGVTLKALQKKYGENVITYGNQLQPIRKIPLGIPAFDYVTTGGFPVHRFTELYGDFSSLKSYFTYVGIGKFQKYDWANNFNDVLSVDVKVGKDGLPKVTKIKTPRSYKPKLDPVYKFCVLIDLEGTYDRAWGKKLGIDNEALIYINPSSLNVSIDLLDAFLSNVDISLVVFDSMIAIGADAEADASMEKEQMGVNAKFWNKAMRKITAAMNRNPEKDVTLAMINGAYEKLGMVFGDPEQTKNGKGVGLAKSMSIRSSALKTQSDTVEGVTLVKGRNITLRNKKNKVGAPFREASLYFSFVDDGIMEAGDTDIVSQLVTLATSHGLITRKGAYYSYKDYKINGFDNFCNVFIEDVEKRNDLFDTVYKEIIFKDA